MIKIGDTVYTTDGVRIYESRVRQIIYTTDNASLAFDKRAIGDSVFLSRDEAERKMKRMNGGQNDADTFEAAANMAERKRERERREALDKHTKNILEKIMNERRAKQEAVQEKAEWKRERERKEALGEHTLEKIMEKIMNERRAMEEAAQEKMEAWEKAEAWDREITYALDKTGDLCTLLGAMVEAVRFENGIIWIRRPGEAIRLQVGEIRDVADLRATCKKMLGSVCKC